MEKAILWVLAAGALLGGADFLLGNKLGLGEKFDEAFRLLGPTALSMAGILCLAPWVERGLQDTLAPLWRRMGLDPAMLGGVLAIDMGGYQTAVRLAQAPLVGSYAGVLVASTLGCTLTFTIPMGFGLLRVADRAAFSKGILIGLGAMPTALLAGGWASGLPLRTLLVETLPLVLVCALLMLGIRCAPRGSMRAFALFARLIRWASIVGLVAGAVQQLTGVALLPGMTPLEEAMRMVCSIGVAMLGSLPAAELLSRALRRPLERLAKRLGMDASAFAGVMVGFVSVAPALGMMRDMDERGKTMNAAFLVCAASTLAAHLGFTAMAEQRMLLPLLLTKGLGGLAGAGLALLFTKRSGRSA